MKGNNEYYFRNLIKYETQPFIDVTHSAIIKWVGHNIIRAM